MSRFISARYPIFCSVKIPFLRPAEVVYNRFSFPLSRLFFFVFLKKFSSGNSG